MDTKIFLFQKNKLIVKARTLIIRTTLTMLSVLDVYSLLLGLVSIWLILSDMVSLCASLNIAFRTEDQAASISIR
jgi:hypothetical protein